MELVNLRQLALIILIMKTIFNLLMKYLIFFVLIITLNFSCKKKVDQPAVDENIIQQYNTKKSLDATATGTGLYYVIDKIGTGISPNNTSTVKVAYKGFLTDGTPFDESSSDGISFSLKNVIKGWQEGIPLFKEGGSGTLLIPSALGYGNQATGKIPKNSVLIFEIELIEVL